MAGVKLGWLPSLLVTTATQLGQQGSWVAAGEHEFLEASGNLFRWSCPVGFYRGRHATCSGHSSNEFRRSIPWRVALQQRPPPLPSLISVLSQWPPFDRQVAANGEPSITQLFQERAQSRHPRATKISKDRPSNGKHLNQKHLFPMDFNRVP